MECRNFPTRRRLALLILVLGCLTVSVETTAFAVYEHRHLQREMAARAAEIARVVGSGVAGGIEARDRGAVRAVLANLAADGLVLEAQVFDGRGQLMGDYRKPGEHRLARVERPAGAAFQQQRLVFSSDIRAQGASVGALSIAYDLRGEQALARRRIEAVAGILLLILMIRIATAMRLVRVLTAPLCYLAAVARDITQRKDYEVRAEPRGRGEVLELIEAFNEMLDQIQIRERARQEAESRLRESEERYALAVRSSNEGVWDCDIATRAVYLSPRLNAMYGDGEAERWTTMEEWLGQIHPDDLTRVKKEVRESIASERATFEVEYRIRHRDGTWRWMHSRAAVVRDEQGKPLRLAGSQADITQAKTSDPVTGLPNRLYLIDRLQEQDRSTERRAPAAVLFMDLDHYRLVSESLGRDGGMELLPQVAGRLRSIVRTAEMEIIAARTGEDEFSILFPHLEMQSEAEEVAARILKQMEQPFFIEGRQVRISGSIGLAVRAPGMSPEELLRNAETAMFHASTQGRGLFATFQEDMRERAQARMDVVSGLHRAIENNELVLHYQPVVSLKLHRVIGFESLVRWQRPGGGLMGPGEFIPLAEESDLILDVGRWVLREACRQMAEWHRRFTQQAPLTIGANLSARQIQNRQWAEEVQEILKDSGLAASRLRLEITESSLLGYSGEILSTLEKLRRMHVGLVLDDFGTGYSSLSYLQRLPFSVIKIDRSFIHGIGGNEGSTEIVRTILNLGRTLRLKVIAEGVETAAQLRTLAALGCEFVQGYYFGRPAPAAEVEPLISDPAAIQGAPAAKMLPFLSGPAATPVAAEPSA